jgi:hypothetical protein
MAEVLVELGVAIVGGAFAIALLLIMLDLT